MRRANRRGVELRVRTHFRADCGANCSEKAFERTIRRRKRLAQCISDTARARHHTVPRGRS
eukprot:603976-Lingulodinium_polyedra.AAC.1